MEAPLMEASVSQKGRTQRPLQQLPRAMPATVKRTAAAWMATDLSLLGTHTEALSAGSTPHKLELLRTRLQVFLQVPLQLLPPLQPPLAAASFQPWQQP